MPLPGVQLRLGVMDGGVRPGGDVGRGVKDEWVSCFTLTLGWLLVLGRDAAWLGWAWAWAWACGGCGGGWGCCWACCGGGGLGTAGVAGSDGRRSPSLVGLSSVGWKVGVCALVWCNVRFFFKYYMFTSE